MLPNDAALFVADAERQTNERDVDGVRKTFAPTATWTVTIDGLLINANGIEEIASGWAVVCRFMELRRMRVTKSLVTADDDTIVNEWTGSLAGRTAARGIEVWHFDENGFVDSNRLYGFLNTRPDTSLLGSLRMLSSYPVTAVAFARAKAETPAPTT